MFKKSRAVVGVLIALVLVTGCSAEPADNLSEDQPQSIAPGSQPDTNTGNGNDAPQLAEGQGVVTVEGVSYSGLTMRSCEPLDDGLVERELELQGYRNNDGVRTQIDVYVQTVGGQPLNDVSWSGPEGVFGSAENLEVTVDDAAGRVYGTATLKDAATHEDKIFIEFDLEIPAETVACR